jgi:hypothetical protein
MVWSTTAQQLAGQAVQVDPLMQPQGDHRGCPLDPGDLLALLTKSEVHGPVGRHGSYGHHYVDCTFLPAEKVTMLGLLNELSGTSRLPRAPGSCSL